ncbi:hypothetical protein BurJ1DRAFT_2590 [Burkholderiales bacterium JOSHI_001]|nr:hypothetical protein BurJ1DRAFT_2590 [Burkholderiales bacterium JOSHI_001]
MSVEGISSPSAMVAAAWADAAASLPAEAETGSSNPLLQAGALAPAGQGAGLIGALAALSEGGALERLLGPHTDSAASTGLHSPGTDSPLSAQTLSPNQDPAPQHSAARVLTQAGALPGQNTAGANPQTQPQAQAQPGPGLDAAPAFVAGAAALAMPAAPPLVPQVPTGLQVNPSPDPAWAFTAPRPRPEPSRPEVSSRSRPDIELPDEDRPPEDEHPASERDEEPDADLEWQDSAPEADWCTPLNQALRAALGAQPLPDALAAAAEQWRLGRCVVLACPQGADFTGPAWAHVLWPRQRGRRLKNQRQGAGLPALHGVRVEAALQWAALPPQGWCHVRAVKTHHPRLGRQLLAIAPQADSASGAQAQAQASNGTPVPCEVQLGPIRAHAPRWQWACIRIHAVRPFWAALGAQWSAHVLVSQRPLVAASAANFKEPS